MLRRTRVSSTPDMSRISQAVARPGIDPRTWCSLAIATDEQFLDKEYGSFIEVELLPTGEALTCYIPQQYAGAGFGEHQQTIHKDDQLVVVIPNGDFAQGGVVVARFHSKVDVPAELAGENPADYVRVQEKDTNWRLTLQGTGQLLFEGEDEIAFKNAKKSTYETETFIAKTTNVRLGEEGASEQLILGTTYRDKESSLHQDIITELTTLATQVGVAGASLTTAGPLVLLPPAGAAVSAAGAALTASVTNITGIVAKITAFEAQAPTYLSNTSKTK